MKKRHIFFGFLYKKFCRESAVKEKVIFQRLLGTIVTERIVLMRQKKNFMHTDLALELQEELEATQIQDGKKQPENGRGSGGKKGEAEADARFFGSGIDVEKRKRDGGRLKEVVITVKNEKGERILGKPEGVYITLEGVDLADNDGEFHEEMSALLAEHLEKLLGNRKNILVAGLGNREVTPDALGPLVVQNLFVTRHLNEYPFARKMRASMAIAPGVMAQTGMETGEILRGIIGKTEPEVLVVIDALAAKTSGRLNKTIQICDTGIAPGAGVGNERQEISEKTMGIPVIAVGVPTVISVPAMAGDIMQSFLESLGDEKMLNIYESWSDQEKYRFMAESLHEELFGLFVTPKEIDEAVKRISYTISEGINRVIARKPA